jgi:ATP-dependent Lhr-like helicase
VADNDLRWWTWAVYRVNATLQATLAGVADLAARGSDLFIRLRGDLRASSWPSLVRAVGSRLELPAIDEKAVAGLKFYAALPRPLAVATLAGRLADFEHAAGVLAEAVRFER